jgi:hypothetical protein
MILKRIPIILALLFVALLLLHFHDLSNFTRPLLDFDDTEFIAPIAGMGVSAYINDWMLQPDHYAFPLRDLTFVADFKLSRLLGFQTFWLTNFAIYAATLFVLFRIFRIYYRSRPFLLVGCLALIALHPINVHMVEWLSNRKHLLVALILGFGTWKALAQKASGATPTLRDWLVYFGYYLAAWLCFPSAALWIFWLLFLFHAELRRRKDRGIPLWAGAIALAGLAYYLITAIASDYRTRAGAEVRPIFFALQSSGRALFNMLFPFQIEPYYRLGHPFAWIGLALLFAVSGLAYYRFRTISADRRHWFVRFFLLASALYLPNARVFLGYSEFAWSDRYLHGCLPFLLLATLVLLLAPDAVSSASPPAPAAPMAPWRWPALAVFTAVALVYFILDWRLVPKWKDGLALFTSCVHEEEAPKCLSMAIDKAFERGGCALLSGFLETAHRIASTASTAADNTFRSEAPLYEGLCIASELHQTADEKLRKIEGLRSIYPMTDHLILAEILVLLQKRDHDGALRLANATYFNPAVPMPGASSKIINMIRGQADALCVLRELVAQDRGCRKALELFQSRVPTAPVNQKQIDWTFRRTLTAFNDGV